MTLGAAGVEVAQQVLAETQTAYLDTLRWVFIAVALGGIAVTIYARLDDWKGAAMIGGLLAKLAGSAWARTALCYGVIALAILLFLLALHRSGERAGRQAERLESMEKTP
ncbi:hypothetical protein HNP73_003356 [Amaricoccus macauensis]|uniref:Uncharacterized protein n=1 Tax=Amaricoccus macauensis TaxID=57001 RepID=A0A840SJW0_9RHOB|nr:hypothetical protein [Amaricoccus macauensis]